MSRQNVLNERERIAILFSSESDSFSRGRSDGSITQLWESYERKLTDKQNFYSAYQICFIVTSFILYTSLLYIYQKSAAKII